MSDNSQALLDSIERWENSNEGLMSRLDSPDLMDRLRDNQPETIGELNSQAYERENVSVLADRYVSAHEEYFKALGSPLTDDQRDGFIQNIPLQANDVAGVSFYLEHMASEVNRYRTALEGEGLNSVEIAEAFSNIPSEREDIVDMAKYYIENSEVAIQPYSHMIGIEKDKDEVNAILSELPPTPSVVAALSFQVENDLGPDRNPVDSHLAQQKIDDITSSQDSVYDVIADGDIKVPQILSMAFVSADNHTGEQSLETLQLAQQQEQAVSAPSSANNTQSYG